MHAGSRRKNALRKRGGALHRAASDRRGAASCLFGTILDIVIVYGALRHLKDFQVAFAWFAWSAAYLVGLYWVFLQIGNLYRWLVWKYSVIWAKSAFNRGEFGRAYRGYRTCAKLCKKDAIYCHNVGVALDRLKRHADAAEWFSRALGLDPFLEESLLGRAHSQRALGYQQAAQHDLRSVELLQTPQ